jgi:Spy/CpxP family protein refolding chaperone
MKRVCLLILAGLIVACISVAVAGEPNEPKGACGLKAGKAFGGPRIETGCKIDMILKMKEELGLSDAQVKELEALKVEIQEKMKASMEAVKAKREALDEAVKSGVEESAIRAAATALGNALGDEAVLKVSINARIDKILTEEQKAKLKEKCAKGKPEAGESASKGPGMEAKGPDAMFAKIDTNGDGAISLEEFKAHMEQMRERFVGEGHGGPMGPMGPRGPMGREPNCPVKPPKD